MKQDCHSLDNVLSSMPAEYWVKERSWLDDINYAMVSLACTLLIPIVLIDKVGLHITVPIIFSIAFVTYLYVCWSLYKKENELTEIWINKQDLPEDHKTQLCNELSQPAIRLFAATGRFIVCLIVCAFILALIAALTDDDKRKGQPW
jgi:Ca2+/Na+ antiporter